MTTAKSRQPIRQPTRQEIEDAIVQLNKARSSQTQLNRWARLSAEEAEQYAKSAAESADLAGGHAEQARHWAKVAQSCADKLDPIALVTVCAGVALLAAIGVCAITLSRIPQMPTAHDNITITP